MFPDNCSIFPAISVFSFTRKYMWDSICLREWQKNDFSFMRIATQMNFEFRNAHIFSQQLQALVINFQIHEMQKMIPSKSLRLLILTILPCLTSTSGKFVYFISTLLIVSDKTCKILGRIFPRSCKIMHYSCRKMQDSCKKYQFLAKISKKIWFDEILARYVWVLEHF